MAIDFDFGTHTSARREFLEKNSRGIAPVTAETFRLGQARGTIEPDPSSLGEELTRGITDDIWRGRGTEYLRTIGALGSERAADAAARRDEENLWRQDRALQDGFWRRVARTSGAAVAGAVELYAKNKLSLGAAKALMAIPAFQRANALAGSLETARRTQTAARVFSVGALSATVSGTSYGRKFYEIQEATGDPALSAVSAMIHAVGMSALENVMGSGAFMRRMVIPGGVPEGVDARLLGLFGRNQPKVIDTLGKAILSPSSPMTPWTARKLAALHTSIEQGVFVPMISMPFEGVIDMTATGRHKMSAAQLADDILWNVVGSIPISLMSGYNAGRGAASSQAAHAKAREALYGQMDENRVYQSFNKNGDLDANPNILRVKQSEFNQAMGVMEGWLTAHMDKQQAEEAVSGLTLVLGNTAAQRADLDVVDLIQNVTQGFVNESVDSQAWRAAWEQNGVEGVVDYLQSVDPNFKSTMVDVYDRAVANNYMLIADSHDKNIGETVKGFTSDERVMAERFKGIELDDGVNSRTKAKAKLGKANYLALRLYGELNNVEVGGENKRLVALRDGGVLVTDAIDMGEVSESALQGRRLLRSEQAEANVQSAVAMHKARIEDTPGLQRLDEFRKAMTAAEGAEGGASVYGRVVRALTNKEVELSALENMTDAEILELAVEIAPQAENFIQTKTGAAVRNTAKALKKTVTIGDMAEQTRDSAIRALIEDGYALVEEGGERFLQKDETRLSQKQLTKTGLDYAEYLLQSDPESISQMPETGDMSELVSDLGNVEVQAERDRVLAQTRPAAPVSVERDQAYLEAADRGDTETAQRMVDEAARAAGYTVGPVWHGTATGGPSITEFSQDRLGEQSGNPTAAWGTAFTPNQSYARGYRDSYSGQAKGLYKAHLAMRNPHRMTYGDMQREYQNLGQLPWDGKMEALADKARLFRKSLEAQGHDGIIVTTGRPASDTRNHDEMFVFSPSQIKSADPFTRDDAGRIIPLSERFQPTSPDIRFQQQTDELTGLFWRDRAERGDARRNFIAYTKEANSETVIHEWVHHLLESGLAPTALMTDLRNYSAGDPERMVDVISAYFRDLQIPDGAPEGLTAGLKSLRKAFANTLSRADVSDSMGELLDSWTIQAMTADEQALSESIRTQMMRAHEHYEPTDTPLEARVPRTERDVNRSIMTLFRGDRAAVRDALREEGVDVGDAERFLTRESTPAGLTHEQIQEAARRVIKKADEAEYDAIELTKAALVSAGVPEEVFITPEGKRLAALLRKSQKAAEKAAVKSSENMARAKAAGRIDAENFVSEWAQPIRQTMLPDGSRVRTRTMGGDRVEAAHATLIEKIQNRYGEMADGMRARIGWDDDKASWLTRVMNQFTSWQVVINDITDGIESHPVNQSIGGEFRAMSHSMDIIKAEVNREMVRLSGLHPNLPLNVSLRTYEVPGWGKVNKSHLMSFYMYSRGGLETGPDGEIRIARDEQGRITNQQLRNFYETEATYVGGQEPVFLAFVKAAENMVATDPQMKSLVEHTRALLDFMGPKTQAVAEMITGEPHRWVENFFPFMRHGDMQMNVEDIQTQLETPGKRPQPDRGQSIDKHTRSRAEQARRQPELDFGRILQSYLAQSELYVGAYPHVFKLQALLHNEEVITAFTETGRLDKLKLLREIADRQKFVNGRPDQLKPYEHMLKFVMNRWRWSTLVLKAPTAMLQPLSVLPQIGRLGGGWFGLKHMMNGMHAARSMWLGFNNPMFLESDVGKIMVRNNASPLHARMGTHTQSMMHGGGLMNTLQFRLGGRVMTAAEAGMGHIFIGDKLGRAPAWWMAFRHKYDDAINKGMSDSQAETVAAAFAEEQVAMTQPSAKILDMNLAQTSNEFTRSLIPFTAFWMRQWDMLRTDWYYPLKRAIADSTADGKFDGTRLIKNLWDVTLSGDAERFGTETSLLKKGFWGLILPSLVVGMIRRGRQPDSEDEILEDLIAYTLMGIPIGGTAVVAAMGHPDAEHTTALNSLISQIAKSGAIALDHAGVGEPQNATLLDTFFAGTPYIGMPAIVLNFVREMSTVEGIDEALPKNVLKAVIDSQFTRWDDENGFINRWMDRGSFREAWETGRGVVSDRLR